MDVSASSVATAPATAPEAARVVLDTNAVLDWLIFRNSDCIALENAVYQGSVRLLTSPAMRAELSHVLARGEVSRWTTDFSLLWETLDQHALALPDPPALSTPMRLRCTDTDDQKFIDFAVVHQAQWLLTRDRAVLKLRKKALHHGLRIASPQAWTSFV